MMKTEVMMVLGIWVLFSAGIGARLIPSILDDISLPQARPLSEVAEPWRPSRTLGCGLGPLRVMVSHLAWLQAHNAWEQQEPDVMEGWLRIVTRTNPENLHFWIEGTRMIAWDTPRWKNPDNDATLRHAAARHALSFLQDGVRFHPHTPEIHAEAAWIWLYGLEEPVRAGELLALASFQPGAPLHYARVRGDLLLHTGRIEEAMGWYRRLLHITAHDPDAQRFFQMRLQEIEEGENE